MTVFTTADAIRLAAKDAAENSARALGEALQEIVIKKCWGHDDYKPFVKQNLIKAHGLALQILQLLDDGASDA